MAAALLMYGCAAPTRITWVRPDGVHDQVAFARDKYRCVQESRTSWSGGGAGWIGLGLTVSAQANAQAQADQLFKMCMEAAGYRIQQIEGPQAAAPPARPSHWTPPSPIPQPADVQCPGQTFWNGYGCTTPPVVQPLAPVASGPLTAVAPPPGGLLRTYKVMINDQGKQVYCGSGASGAGMVARIDAECVKNQTALGFVDLDDFEKTEPPKLEQRPGLTPPEENPPQWEPGYVWTYKISGVRSGITRQEVTGTESVKGVNAYVVSAGQSTFLLTDQLHAVQTKVNGIPTATYTPPFQSYDWPLTVGKTWDAKGERETRTGKVNISAHFEVKGYGIVRVPAGEFEAFYLLSKSAYGARESEVWYSPKIRRHVKVVGYWSEGRTTAELISYSIGPLTYSAPANPQQPTQIATPPAQPVPSAPPVPQEAVAPKPAPVASLSPSGPWLGVPLGAPDQASMNRSGIGPGRGAMVLPFTKDPKLPPIDLDPGDVILAIDGVEVEGPGHVMALLANKAPGSTVQVRVFRDRSQQQGDQPMVIFLGRP